MNESARKGWRPWMSATLFFAASTAAFLLWPSTWEKWHISPQVILAGNLLIFLATLGSGYFYHRSLRDNNAHMIIRMIYAGTLLKMLVLLAAALIYISVAGKQVSKGAIFGCMFLYLVYAFIEISGLLKNGKRSNNA